MTDLFEVAIKPASGPVEVLGIKFNDDSERRAYFIEKLREHIEDSSFRSSPDFPNAKNDDILRLSNPPYYTACPNPFLAEFVSWAKNKEAEPATTLPFMGDLVVDSRDPVYSFHPYHTKVPPAIIQTLIEHYTRPGDLILDAFSGSGMTGVAARNCGRRSIIVDLSPIAGFVSHINTYTNPSQRAANLLEAAIKQSRAKLGWMYETKHGTKNLEVNYFVWSDIFTCPECVFEFPFFPHGVIHHGNKVETRKSFDCPSCGAELNVRRVERVVTEDGKKKALAWVNAGTGRGRINRAPSKHDQDVVAQIQSLSELSWFPTDTINPIGYSAKLAQLGDKGITNVSRFLSERNRIVFADLWERAWIQV